MALTVIDGDALCALLVEDGKDRDRIANGEDVAHWNPETMGKATWDPTLATFVPGLGRKAPKVESTGSVLERFRQLYPFWKWDGEISRRFVVAGGAVASLMTDQNESDCHWDPSDTDFFLVNSSGDPTADLRCFIREIRAGVNLHVITMLCDSVEGFLGSHAKEFLNKNDMQCLRTAMEELREAVLKRQVTGVLADLCLEDMVRELPHVGFERAGRFNLEKEVCFLRPQGILESTWNGMPNKTRDHTKVARCMVVRVPTYNCIRTANSFSMEFKLNDRSYKLQVILRVYKSPEEVVYGFDLGSCAVAIDFQNLRVVMSRMARFAYQTGNNVVDTTRRSLTFEARLWKYWKRGFGFIAPQFDVSKVPVENFKYNLCQVVELPKLPLECQLVHNNEIVVSTNLGWWKQQHSTSDYDAEDSIAVAHNNFQCLLGLHDKDPKENEARNFIHIGSAREDPLLFLSEPPLLSLPQLSRYAEGIHKQLWQDGLLRIRLLSKFCPTEDISELAKLDCDAIRDRVKQIAIAVEKDAKSIWKREIADVDWSQFKWVTKDPNSQLPGYKLTGSINPIFVPPQDWYGSYYKDVEGLGPTQLAIEDAPGSEEESYAEARALDNTEALFDDPIAEGCVRHGPAFAWVNQHKYFESKHYTRETFYTFSAQIDRDQYNADSCRLRFHMHMIDEIMRDPTSSPLRSDMETLVAKMRKLVTGIAMEHNAVTVVGGEW